MKYILQLTVFMLLFFQTSCNAEQSKDIVQDSSNMENFTTRVFEIKNTESGNMLRGTLYLPETAGRHPVIITSHEVGSDSQRAVGTFPNARLYILKGAGHVFIKDEQQKEFLEQADAFLNQL